MIYLDNAATTFPKPECVYQALDEYHRNSAVNAGRGAYRLSRAASDMIREVKKEMVRLCGARNRAHVVFTPSVTIALNQLIAGQDWKRGDVAYVSPYEHNAVTRPLTLMVSRYGIRVEELPLREDLSIDLDEMRRMFAEAPPRFVCVTAISNVTGYILPAKEIFSAAKQYDAFTVLDAAQALGYLEITFGDQEADAIAFAGHKSLYAAFGIAGMYLRYGVELKETITGGNGILSTSLTMPAYAPERYEAGSMDTPAIASLAASLQWLKAHPVRETEEALTSFLTDGLRQIPAVKVYCAPGAELQGPVVSFNLADIDAGVTGTILDRKYDIAVRSGHHCAALIHRHLQDEANKGCVRISIGAFNTRKDIEELIAALQSMNPETIRNMSPGDIAAIC